MLSVQDFDGRHTGWMVLLYATALLPVSLLPTLLGVTGPLYFFGALALGLAYAGASVALTRAVTVPRAWRVFFVSIVYLPALLTAFMQVVSFVTCVGLVLKKIWKDQRGTRNAEGGTEGPA